MSFSWNKRNFVEFQNSWFWNFQFVFTCYFIVILVVINSKFYWNVEIENSKITNFGIHQNLFFFTKNSFPKLVVCPEPTNWKTCNHQQLIWRFWKSDLDDTFRLIRSLMKKTLTRDFSDPLLWKLVANDCAANRYAFPVLKGQPTGTLLPKSLEHSVQQQQQKQ